MHESYPEFHQISHILENTFKIVIKWTKISFDCIAFFGSELIVIFRPNPTDFDVHDPVAFHNEPEGFGRQPGRPVDDGPGGGWLQDQARLPHHGLLAPPPQLCHE